MADPIGPRPSAPVPSRPTDTARAAFFQAAMRAAAERPAQAPDRMSEAPEPKAANRVAQAAPAAETAQQSQVKAIAPGPGDRLLRPGSLLDIRV